MKNKIISLMLGMLLLSSGVYAFNLVEGFKLFSTHRSDARIDNNWLINEETDSELKGFFAIPFSIGFIDINYSGHNIIGDEYSLNCNIELIDSFEGTYGHHFVGVCDELEVHYYGTKGVTVYNDVDVTGFYRGVAGQIYVSFHHKNLGMTWVTFMQDYIEPAYISSSYGGNK